MKWDYCITVGVYFNFRVVYNEMVSATVIRDEGHLVVEELEAFFRIKRKVGQEASHTCFKREWYHCYLWFLATEDYLNQGFFKMNGWRLIRWGGFLSFDLR